MKLYRVILVCTLLLLAVTPSYAVPTCTECLDTSTCINAPGIPSRCRFINGACETLVTSFCVDRSEDDSVLADWKIASIEVRRQAPGSSEVEKTVTAPASIAHGGTPQLPAAK